MTNKETMWEKLSRPYNPLAVKRAARMESLREMMRKMDETITDSVRVPKELLRGRK